MVKQFFKNTPNSVFFWNGLALIAFIVLCCMGENVALGTMIVISIPALFMIMVNLEDSRYDKNVKIIGYHYWAYLAPITWILMVIGIVLFVIVWVVMQAVEQVELFNNWLNKK